MTLHPICAGDLIRTLKALEPEDDATRAAIAGLLGYELRMPKGAAKVEQPKIDRTRGRDEQRPEKRDPGVTILPGSSGALGERRFELQKQKDKASTVPMRLIAQPASDPLPSTGPEDSLPSPPLDPLFTPQWSRAMISTLARIRSRTGPPSVETLVALAAERKPISSLPASISETASGADVLMDVGESMTLFARDQQWLLHLIRRVHGVGLVSPFRFFGSPARGVLGALSFDLQAYRPPRPGWPVIVLTDLGIGAGTAAAPSEEWRWFSHLVRGAGCQLLALVPYPPVRWPPAISSAMDVIQWDRATSVRTIRAVLGHPERSRY